MRRVGTFVAVFAVVGCHRDLDVCPDDSCVERDSAPVEEAATGDAEIETGTDSGPNDTAPSDANAGDSLPDGCTGVCTPGEVATVSTPCPGALEKKTKTCTSSCTWGPEVCALPKGWTAMAESPIAGRVQNSAVWTGGELIVYGGGTSIDGGPGMSDGAIYSVLNNSWQVLPTNTATTAKRKRHVACWTGTEMVIWGGLDGASIRGDGFVYNAFSKAWFSTATSPLAARQRSAGTWIPSTKRLFIWGGDGDTAVFADGALYDPSSATWSTLPTAPLSARYWSYALWTGKEVVVWGGRNLAGLTLTDGAAFDPSTGKWRVLSTSPATGRLFASVGLLSDTLVVFGGSDLAGTDYWDGLKLPIAGSSSWSAIAAPPSALLSRRAWQQAWFAGDRMTLWSGIVEGAGGEAVFDQNGASFDAKSGTWTALDVTGAPTPRALATTSWTGNYAIVWSGMAKPGGGVMELVQGGAIYVP